ARAGAPPRAARRGARDARRARRDPVLVLALRRRRVGRGVHRRVRGGTMSAPDRDHIELPAPTAWPMVAALGIAFSFAGLVMHPLVSMVGAVLVIAGAVGWFGEVLPVEHIERVPLVPLAQRARPVQPV